jgi:hypothetical protein
MASGTSHGTATLSDNPFNMGISCATHGTFAIPAFYYPF